MATFKEINLEYVMAEDNCFVLDSPHSLPLLFAPEEGAAVTESKRQEKHRIANMLATVCATLGEMPHVRSDTRPMASSLAAVLQTKLEELGALSSTLAHRTLALTPSPSPSPSPNPNPNPNPNPSPNQMVIATQPRKPTFQSSARVARLMRSWGDR